MNPKPPTLTCSLCGHRFDPTDLAGCQGCPLQTGCSLVRCPACGFENVNPERSQLAKLFRRAFLRQSEPPPSDTRSTSA